MLSALLAAAPWGALTTAATACNFEPAAPGDQSTTVTHVRNLITQPLLAATALATTTFGLTIGAVTADSSPAAAAAPITVQLKWSHWLDDAPCAVAESSPVTFNPDGSS